MRRGEIKDRLDASYFSLADSLTRSKFPIHALGDHFWVRDGDHAKFPDNEIAGPDGVRYLRSQDLKDGIIIDDASIYVSRRYFEKLGRSHIKPGYLLFSIMASIGNCAVVPDGYPDATANRAVGILVPKYEDRLITAYVAFLFETELGAGLYARIKKGGLQQRTNLADVERLQFPMPTIAKQRELVDAMEAAREARRAKLAEADALLAGMDAYLLDTLGLAPPPADDRRSFALKLGALREQSRLGPDYFHPERILAIRAMEAASSRMACAKLSDIVAFVRDQIKAPDENYIGLAGVQSRTGELSGVEEEAEGTCFTFQQGDVLFARLRPYLNKVWCADSSGCCSPEFHVLRVINEKSLQPEYLAAVLRSSLILAQTRHMMTGNTHPRLANEDVVNLVVPIPDPMVQQSIAAEIRRRRERARVLRVEAEAGWFEAKHWFEEQLLGPAN